MFHLNIASFKDSLWVALPLDKIVQVAVNAFLPTHFFNFVLFIGV